MRTQRKPARAPALQVLNQTASLVCRGGETTHLPLLSMITLASQGSPFSDLLCDLPTNAAASLAPFAAAWDTSQLNE